MFLAVCVQVAAGAWPTPAAGRDFLWKWKIHYKKTPCICDAEGERGEVGPGSQIPASGHCDTRGPEFHCVL